MIAKPWPVTAAGLVVMLGVLVSPRVPASLPSGPSSSGGAAPSKTQEAGKIIEKHVEAMGGIERIRAIKTIRAEGRLEQQGVDLPFTLWMKRPNLSRMDMDLQGRMIVQAYDGKRAWWVNPLLGAVDPQEMPEDFAKAMVRWTDFEGPLVDFKQKGHTAEYEGEETTESGRVHKIKLVLKSGEVWHVYIDAKTYLEVKRSFPQTLQGKAGEVTTRFPEHTVVAGVTIYRVIEGVGLNGLPYTMTFDSFEANPDIDDARFEKP